MFVYFILAARAPSGPRASSEGLQIRFTKNMNRHKEFETNTNAVGPI